MNIIEVIDYIENSKVEALYYYKNKYKSYEDKLRSKNLWIIVRKLFEIIGPKGDKPVDKKYRKRVVKKALSQMTSDSYIESMIDWNEYNILNTMIENIDIDEIEEEVYRNIETSICDRCC